MEGENVVAMVDRQEFDFNLYSTNPLLADSDGDGVSDYDKVSGGAPQPGPSFRWGDYLPVVLATIAVILLALAFLVKVYKKR